MTRSIDSILAAHKAATERSAVARPIWDRKLRIKQLLSPNSSDFRARATGKSIAMIVRTSQWLKIDQRDAEQAGGESELALLVDEFEKTGGPEDLNLLLDKLYDLADADRVWIE